MKRTRRLIRPIVTADGDGLVSHAGAALLSELADRLGLTDDLAEAMAPARQRRSAHDPGEVLRDLAVVLADGGDCLAHPAVLRDQPDLFGDVASGPTAWRVLASVDGERLVAVERVRAAARARAWKAGDVRTPPSYRPNSINPALLGGASFDCHGGARPDCRF